MGVSSMVGRHGGKGVGVGGVRGGWTFRGFEPSGRGEEP